MRRDVLIVRPPCSDEAELSELVHEEIHARSRRADKSASISGKAWAHAWGVSPAVACQEKERGAGVFPRLNTGDEVLFDA